MIGLEEYETFREVDLSASKWKGGGGVNEEYDSDIYDCAFFNSTDQQSTAITNQLIDGYMDIRLTNSSSFIV